MTGKEEGKGSGTAPAPGQSPICSLPRVGLCLLGLPAEEGLRRRLSATGDDPTPDCASNGSCSAYAYSVSYRSISMS